MRFVWFWTFWHWSKESFRAGALLRSPLQGIGSHWDEWFRNEASPNDLALIEEAGRSKSTQREFLAWLFRHWAGEVQLPQSRMVPCFVAAQLAQIPPFDRWAAFEKYRTSYGAAGISAIVLTEDSQGEPRDIRTVEAIALPADSTGSGLVPEGFQAEASELASAKSAAKSLLSGRGLLVFIVLWVMSGQRPYARWLSHVLTSGWIATAGLILLLLVGPEPGNQLFFYCALLVALWGSLIAIAIGTVTMQALRAWRVGKALSSDLETSHVRLRMNGGLRLKGASAGMPFCLNMLLGLHYARPDAASRSWIWRRFFSAMKGETKSWAGTGVVTASGFLLPVVLEPKLRACLRHEQIRHVLTPHQREVNNRTLNELSKSSIGSAKPAPVELFPSKMQVGLAAERPRLRVYGCRHIAQAVMTLGRFGDRRRILANVFALAVTAIMLLAAPDLRSILLPHHAPVAIEPASPSPYFIWASLDTRHPRYFGAVLESPYWSNRRADVRLQGGLTPSVRAEIQLHRVIATTAADHEEGFVWIERRRRFLTREFLPGERVGRYSIRYLTRLGHE
jgi:hypothetical protein